jgi:hypothetical protein
VPAAPEIATGGWTQGARVIECDYIRALEITFDNPHIFFLHPTHPSAMAAAKHGLIETIFEFRTTETGCLWFSPPAPAGSGLIPNEAVRVEFFLPGRIRFSVPYGPADGASLYVHVTPQEPGRCRLHWLAVDAGTRSNQELRWVGSESKIIEEDARALEATQKAYDAEGEDFERSVEADLPTLALRAIVRAAERGRWDAAKSLLPRRRLFRTTGAAFPEARTSTRPSSRGRR